MNRRLLAVDLFVIGFVAWRLYLEYGNFALAQYWFANAHPGYPYDCIERLFGNGSGHSGGLVIPYWFFPDYLKSKTFLFAFAFPWFSWRLIEKKYEWSRLDRLMALIFLYSIVVGITVALWTNDILVRSVPSLCGPL